MFGSSWDIVVVVVMMDVEVLLGVEMSVNSPRDITPILKGSQCPG